MSLELIDKEVSTEDLDTENVEEKKIQEQSTKKKEKKETTDLEKLEAVLSVLVENKVTSIRNCGGNKVKERNFLFSKFRSKAEGAENAGSDSKLHKIRTNSSETLAFNCKFGCHHHHHHHHHHGYHHGQTHQRCRSLLSPVCGGTNFCQGHGLARYRQTSIKSSSSHHQSSNQLYPQQSFESYDPSLCYPVCGRRPEPDQRPVVDKRKFPVQKCLPKQLSTEQWLNSTTSRQASTETATTSSGYISPTFGIENKRHRPMLSEGPEAHQLHDSTETGSNGESETIIDMSKLQAQKPLDAIEESKSIDEVLLAERQQQQQQQFATENELEHFKLNINQKNLKPGRIKYNESCHVLLPQCVSTTCLSTCRCSTVDDRGGQTGGAYRHLHPSGGHYMSCYNSPTHSCQRFQYDENYLTLVMNLEDLEFEQEEERRKRRKRRKKRRKERQIRARGLMADELKSVKKASKVLDPEDLPKRARWTIVATACLLLLMSMLLVGVTLRMAPIIDEMVRKENEEMLHSLSRQGAVKEVTSSTVTALNVTRTSSSTLRNSSGQL